MCIVAVLWKGVHYMYFEIAGHIHVAVTVEI